MSYMWKLFHFEKLYKKATIGQQFFSDTFYSPSNSRNHLPYAWRIILDPKTTRVSNAIGFFLEAFKTVDEQKEELKTRELGFDFIVYRLDLPTTPESKEKKWTMLAQQDCPHQSFDYSGTKSWGFGELLKVESIWPHNDQTAEVDLMVKVTVQKPQETFSSFSGITHGDDEWIDQKEFSDITFTFPQGEKIHAHRLILSKRSEYFNKMFMGLWNEADSDTIAIKEVSYETFYALIYYLYTNKLKEGLSNETLVELYEQAHLRLLTSLSEALISPLLHYANDDNWDHLYSLAWKFEHATLQQAVMNFAEKRWNLAVKTENMKRILQWGGVKALEKLSSAKNLHYPTKYYDEHDDEISFT
ncbi:3804_t:CDS:1 [Ambispora gerdemannii]|uniref:3804_t:CDS:1 n=1 Tax=Ambispora gerdemannii TaxID=144530 RepID=A0A9N8ZGR2_9GLOM|nr:3804_t:CDS:1 [Ambispora gerdemannii]